MADEKRPKNDEDPAVSRFREYLRINTVQPDPDYGRSHRCNINYIIHYYVFINY